MSVDATTVRRIAHLARIAVSDAEVPHLQGELNAMLAFVEQLSEVNIEGVEPMTSVTPMAMYQREDVVNDGEIADAITQRFEATSPIYIDVSTEKRYREPGCSRLKVLFWQEGVKLPDVAAPRRQTIEFGINYCLDGLPPKSLR